MKDLQSFATVFSVLLLALHACSRHDIPEMHLHTVLLIRFQCVFDLLQRSVEDEINRESKSDVKTVIISYMVMFIYVTFALGYYTRCSRILVRSIIFNYWNFSHSISRLICPFQIDIKITLGLVGVLIVILSVVCSLGIWSYAKIPATLIIIEVVPFLVLAVGVDNIFILVQAYQRERDISEPAVEDAVASVVGKVGPSMLLTSLSESVAFFFGAMTPMPAVKVFCLYAGLAILLDFLLQVSSCSCVCFELE